MRRDEAEDRGRECRMRSAWLNVKSKIHNFGGEETTGMLKKVRNR